MGRRGRVGGSSSAKWTCRSFTGASSVEGGAGLGRGGYAGPFSFNIEGVLLGILLVSITAVFSPSTGVFSSSGMMVSVSVTIVAVSSYAGGGAAAKCSVSCSASCALLLSAMAKDTFWRIYQRANRRYE